MSDEYEDPSGNTQAFRSFAQQRDEPAPSPLRAALPLIVAGVVAVVVVVVVLLLIFR